MMAQREHGLFRIAGRFLRLGATGFGGPVAIVAMMQKEFCVEKKWIPLEEFHETFVLTKMFPGPLATQMAVWVGHRLGGRWGGVISGVCLLLPAFLLMLALAHFSAAMNEYPKVALALEGMRVAALVLIVDSVSHLFKPYKRQPSAWIVALCGAVGMWIFPKWEPLIVIGGGLSLVLVKKIQPLVSVAVPSLFWSLFLVHAKGALFVFGTGIAIVPYLETQTVSVMKWLSREEFLNGLAFGQITPGPIMITSTYIGYRAAAFPGALAATFGMFLPGFILVLFFLPVLRQKLKRSQWLPAFQLGAISAIVGCIITAVFVMSKAMLKDTQAYGLFLILWALSSKYKIPSWVLIPLGCIAMLAWPR